MHITDTNFAVLLMRHILINPTSPFSLHQLSFPSFSIDYNFDKISSFEVFFVFLVDIEWLVIKDCHSHVQNSINLGKKFRFHKMDIFKDKRHSHMLHSTYVSATASLSEYSWLRPSVKLDLKCSRDGAGTSYGPSATVWTESQRTRKYYSGNR